MVQARLRDGPPFVALSYEWGPPDDAPDTFILVNGCSTLRIRRNLYDALKEIRAWRTDADYCDTHLPFWVDAICINQQNPYGEKPNQVRLMGAIFSQAMLAVAWLGVPGNGSNIAINILDDYAVGKDHKRAPWDNTPTFAEGLHCYCLGAVKRSIVALCTRSYWRRVWILQEIWLAQNFAVLCGRDWIHGDRLRDAFDMMSSLTLMGFDKEHGKARQQELMDILDFNLRKNIPYKHLKAQDTRCARLGQLVEICLEGSFQSTEPRDYIFALISVSTDDQIGQIVVDYQKPVQMVYREALPILRLSFFTETWKFSWGSHATLAQRLASKMGTEFDYDLDITGVNSLVKLVPGRNGIAKDEWDLIMPVKEWWTKLTPAEDGGEIQRGREGR
ncbi:hypothetical protein SMACR_09462 [Sordaria macrospora]|uniref:WGS project CABT00000000 data, contig 2.5 n=2 Tax=Sordaria macrospora TaxID=5147 RepID=F7VRG0_SORMK|nr:uncharacterized protein SMAC_09462 [Sordaria macrospora k-hell]KAA8628154.1 hypothetical protein SMACR_09462 [Sordaria macrospora]KAH7626167.1 heterokaryon incompatibility protein-domain-containing protein [Sordaria sp. MPI-SDFR-AT-0083]WPJ61339.1 hypothetical protein SMAC4_09462 [Sordaria macrospora]CCC08095.1 unnamed protein product [Sordaria macrospora k-hell]